MIATLLRSDALRGRAVAAEGAIAAACAAAGATIAALVAFVASAAGAYFSGCQFSLR